MDRGLGQAGPLREIALGEAFLLPQDTQKHPLAEADIMLGKPESKRPIEATRAKPHQMGEAFIHEDGGVFFQLFVP